MDLTPVPQDFELLTWCSIVESELTFFQEQRERFFMNAIVFSQHTLGLTPKILNPINMVFAFGKVRGMIDAFMLETAHIKGVV